MSGRSSVWRAPGMVDLAVLAVFGFSGYAALLATAPLWAVAGGATAAGAGLVNGVLLTATVLAQLAVPRALGRWGNGPVLVAGLLLLGVPSPAYLLSDGLAWSLALSAVRGVGFGILTVVAAAVVVHLVPPARRGAAIGVYGLGVAVPSLLLLPASVPVVEGWGFGPVFWAGALPLLGVASALRLARVLRGITRAEPAAGPVAGPAAEPAGAPEPPPRSLGGLRGLVRPTLVLRGITRAEPAGAPEPPPRSLGGLRGLVRPTLVLFSVTMAGGALLTFAPQLTDPGTAAAVLATMGATAALSRWLVGALADRHGARPFLVPVLAAAAVAMTLCAWAVARQADGVLIGAATVFGLCYGALHNLTLVEAFAAVEPPQLPAASAGWNIGFDAGTAAGSVLTGALATAYSFPVALTALAALCLLVSLLQVRRRSDVTG